LGIPIQSQRKPLFCNGPFGVNPFLSWSCRRVSLFCPGSVLWPPP